MIITEDKLNGRYELEKELGRGAFGVAYLARDTGMHSRPVVIKIPLEVAGRTFDDPLFRKQFDGEIKALALIQHPGVVHIYEYGWTPEGIPFFVMQYVEGESLRSAMRGPGMELKRSARIISQLGSALSAAHDVGVIHRDLKPENVMLQTFGNNEFAFLIDFGVATIRDLQAGGRAQGTWAGTPLYMAPEQLRGEPVPASDVWSLGVVAYEMATGQLPFPANDVFALDNMQRVGIKPKTLRRELPEAAQEVILKALSYDPAARYPQADEMGEDFLRAVIAGEAPTLLSDYPPTLHRQIAPPTRPLYELLQHCRNLFKDLDEFRNPNGLRDFFLNGGLNAYEGCVGRATDIDFNQLLACLSRSGREYRGQALVDLLALLASHYRDKHQEQEFEGLRSNLRQLFAQARK